MKNANQRWWFSLSVLFRCRACFCQKAHIQIAILSDKTLSKALNVKLSANWNDKIKILNLVE